MSPTGRTSAPERRPAPARRPPARGRPNPEVAVEATRPLRRLWWWALGVVGVVVVLVGVAVLSPLLDVEELEVTGVTPERAVEVRRAAGVEVGDPILTFWPGSIEGRVRDLPWVGRVDVVRELPSTVRIDVVPRVPVGWIRAGTRVLVVDAQSRVLGRIEERPPGLPELVGVADVAPPGGDIAPRSLASAAGTLGSELRSRTSALVLQDGTLIAQIAAGPQIRYGAPRGMGLKARVAAAVLASIGDAPIAYVDVSVPAAPVSG